MNQKNPRLLCLWFPDWPVQSYLQKHPRHRPCPIAFYVNRGRYEEIVSCSDCARKIGLCEGMRVHEAEALVGESQLKLLPLQPSRDLDSLLQLAAECQRFSPFVALENAEYPSSLIICSKGLVPLWGPTQEAAEKALLESVDHWLIGRGLIGHAAVASTPGLAWAAAHFSECLESDSLDGRIVADIKTGDIAKRLPIASLRIAESTLSTLSSLGIHTVDLLTNLPRTSLRSRFGDEILWRIDQLYGEAPEPLTFYESTHPLVAQWSFEKAVSNCDVLQAVLFHLLQRLCEGLADRLEGALRVEIRYYLEKGREDQSSKRILLRLFRATACSKDLAELAELQLSQTHFSDAVSLIRVQVHQTAPLEIRQKNLFDEGTDSSVHELAKLVNRLASHIGSDNVSRVRKRQSHDLRRCFQLIPAAEFEAKRFPLTSQQAKRFRRLPLAVQPDESQVLQVRSLQGRSPNAISIKGWQEVVNAWGPDRVETGWWRGRGYRRDAYWVELKDGSRLWLNYDRFTQAWCVSGEFL